jgi:phosphatidylserine/phosphatidylglycerophosphate/cardiolipin synthase-like enzyme
MSMKRVYVGSPLLGLLLVLGGLCAGCQYASSPVVRQPSQVEGAPVATAAGIDVYFSPKGGCQDAIIKELDTAKVSVHLQAYSFTSAPIAKALLGAHERGVKVEVVIDKSRVTEGYSEVTFLMNQDIPVFADGKHAIAHNKVMIIDGKTVIAGSFNFTKAAEEQNAENLLVIRSPELAAKYEQNYQEHLAHSVKLERKE